MNPARLNGNDLTFTDLHEVVYRRRPVLPSGDAREKINAARAVVDALVENNQLAYAITTGVGKLSDVRIEPAQILQLQLNLIRSHSTGVGEPLSQEETRAMMLLRANSLAKGLSGVRVEVIDLLCEMLNRGVHPVVPSQGSVGASGDLAPLAHLALVMIGEGEAVFEHAKISGGEAMRRAGLKPLVPQAKEAISLINGTQAMLAVGTLALLQAENLATTADVLGALSLDALHGTDVAFDERIHAARPHAGQMKVASNLRRLIAGSQIRESHKNCGRVQDAYSLRCIPQVHGAVRDTLEFCWRTFEIEINSAVDNPLVFLTKSKDGHEGEGDVISGGNFHGQPLAFALDFMAIALTALAGISERRIERLVNPALNEGLPPFLAADAGMNSGFMMPQVAAAALASENKVLAHPASVDSITTSGNKEDYVSMGMTAAIKLKRIVANATNVLAIEACTAAQALDFLAPLKTSYALGQAHAAIRKVSPRIERDRVLAGDISSIASIITEGVLAEVIKAV
ncbi:MAG TPA: histidine ammonia-lyase [Terriglobales bacterium]